MLQLPFSYPFYNVKHFGAIANGNSAGGGTDNTAAFQAAVDAADAAGGGIVWIPNGIYRKDGETTLYSNITVLGESVDFAGIVFARGAATAGAVIDCTNLTLGAATRKAAFVEFAGNGHSVSIRNIAIIGPIQTTFAGEWYNNTFGILLGEGHSYSWLENVIVQGFHHGIMFDYAQYVSLKNCYSAGAYNEGLVFRWVHEGRIEGGQFQNSPGTLPYSGYGIHITSRLGGVADRSQNIEINMELNDENYKSPIWIDCSDHIIVRGNNVFTGSVAGIEIDNTTYITIDGHHIGRYLGAAVLGNTIKIAASSTNTTLSNIRTSPNGGGDISDLASDTIWHNVNGISKSPYGATKGGRVSTAAEATATLSGASTTIQVNVPTGARLIGCELQVETAVTSGDGASSWAAAYSGGATQTITTGKAFALNTEANTWFNSYAATNIAASEVDIAITPNSGTFSGGAIRAIVFYETLYAMTDV